VRVLIIGASRGIGLETVKQALEAGHNVRAFARSSGQVNITHARLEKIVGDALVPKDVESALKDVDVVIQTLGVALNAKMIMEAVTVFSEATRVLLPAMIDQGVSRLIAVTGFGAGDSQRSISPLQRLPFQAIFGRAYGDKHIQEDLIRNSGLNWVIARPGVLTNGRRTKSYKVLTDPGTWKNGVISRADVADFLVQQIDSDAYLSKTPVLRY
jgi:putative NADH-flavin reductase